MADKKPQQIIDEALAKGGVLAVMYFDISAKEKDVVQASLADLISRIAHEPGIMSTVGEIEEPIEIEGVWSTSAEVTMLAKNMSVLAVVALRFGPLGVEVIRPDPVRLSLGEAQNLLMNIAQVGHEFSQFALEKLMSAKEREDFNKKLAARAEQGKRILGKMKEEKKE